jgi:hypothetical protein
MVGADSFVGNLDPGQQSQHATQRYMRGYSDIDMWNFDSFLADVIVAGCDWHIANAKTTPWHLEPGEWVEILQEIRAGFVRRGENLAPDPPKRAWKLLRKNFMHFWD